MISNGRPHGRRGFRRFAVALLVAATGIVVPAAPADAAAYNYYAGHPAFALPQRCTGGFAIAGASGVFVVTAGHCVTDTYDNGGTGVTGRRVSGTDEPFGTVIRNDWIGDFYTTDSFDGALIRLDPDDTAYQIVEDPITHTRPGNGRVRGWYETAALYAGMRIGKMGITSGWREGTITGWSHVQYPNGWRFYVLCSTADSLPGDSGGPVWRNDGTLRAVGISIGGSMGTACFIPIQAVLSRFGAWLPVFTSAAAGARPTLDADAASVVTERAGPPLPHLPGTVMIDTW